MSRDSFHAMRRWAALLVLAVLTLMVVPRTAMAADDTDRVTPPLGKGMPIMVRVGVYFAEIADIDENEGEFVATIDVRLRWEDPRLAYAKNLAPRGFVELRDDAAVARLAEIWSPDVVVANLAEVPSEHVWGLRISPTGSVELMQRIGARLLSDFDFERFPFDHQKLRV